MYEKCFYKSVCEKECVYESGCNDCYHMQLLMDKGHIPKTMQHPHKMYPQKCDEKAFEKLFNIASNIVQFVNQGKSLCIFSANVGNGKTTWAVRMLLNYFDWAKDYYSDNLFGAFVNVPEFLFNAKSEISNPTSWFNEYHKSLYNCKLLVLDDIGLKVASGYDTDLLYVLINYRTNNGLSTIYTSNVLKKDLYGYLDNRIVDRILDCSGEYYIELKGVSERG